MDTYRLFIVEDEIMQVDVYREERENDGYVVDISMSGESGENEATYFILSKEF